MPPSCGTFTRRLGKWTQRDADGLGLAPGSGSVNDDAELIRATAGGDSSAFATLVRRHIRAVTILGTQMLGDQDDAEDVVQEAFILLYKRARTFDVARPLFPWLCAVVRRLASNRRARDSRRQKLLALWGKLSGGVAQPRELRADSALEAAEGMDRLRRAMTVLSPMQRACFELVAVRGFSAREAAEMHGMSEATVRQHVFRARRALSHVLVHDRLREETPLHDARGAARRTGLRETPLMNEGRGGQEA